MPTPVRAIRVQGVHRPPQLNVKIRLDGDDPAFGSIEDLRGDVHPFWGWLELIELLQQLSSPQGEPTNTNTPSKEAP